jgi:hypothetical protein
MKVFRYFLVTALTVCSAIAGCGRSNNLGAGYILNDGDADHIYVTKADGDHPRIAIDQQIVDWKVERNYALFLRMVAESVDCHDENGKISIRTHYSTKAEYWIIDLGKDRLIGPLSKKEFAANLSTFKLHDPGLTVRRDYHPNTDEFRKIAKSCDQR